jgi:hypothetical protein
MGRQALMEFLAMAVAECTARELDPTRVPVSYNRAVAAHTTAQLEDLQAPLRFLQSMRTPPLPDWLQE